MTIRVLYLFSGIRNKLVEKAKHGEDHGDGTWGMRRLPHFGIKAEHLELEQFLPEKLAKFIRNYLLGNYGAHLPFFFNFFSYDIIFTAGAFYSQMLFTMARTIFGFKRPLWVMHDFSITGFLGEGKTIKQKLFRFIIRRAAGIVTVGKEETERLAKIFPHLEKHLVYIPFGVDTTFFRPRQGAEETRRILSSGIDPDRDWETLFKACKELDVEIILASRPRGHKDIALPSRTKRQFFSLEELVNEYGQASVIVIPLDTRAGVNDAMGSTALFEAMAMGKAIIATDTPTMRSHIIHGENGILVPERDADAMRAAIQQLIEDKEMRLRLGRSARAYAVENLDAEKMTAMLANYFKTIINQTMS